MTSAPKMTDERVAALDGLRGVAAFAVLLLHASEIFRLNWVPHQAFTAVDFFFLLSGYVIAQTYDARLTRTGPVEFVMRRVIRLYPLVFVGVALGVVVLAAGVLQKGEHSLAQVALDGALACLLLPSLDLDSLQLRVFDLDPPLWSLTFEFVANLLYAFGFAFLLQRSRLVLLVAASAAALCLCALMLNRGSFGLDYFHLASFRVLTSFFLGVLFARSAILKHLKGSISPLVLMFVVAVISAILFNTQGDDGLIYIVTIYVAFPILFVVTLMTRPLQGAARNLSMLAGEISYPLYIVHHPICRAVSHLLFVFRASEGVRFGVMAVLTVVIVALSFGFSRLYDQPVRAWLQSRLAFGSARR